MSSGLFTSAETSTAHDVGGLPWWWHTPDDTIDKIDPEVLERDTKIYLLATLRIATAGLLPFRYEPAARQIREAIEAYGAAAASRIDLTLPSRRAAELQERTAELDALLVRASARTLTDETVTAINRHLMRMDRELVMLNFTGEAPFDQDLAIPIPTVPLLAPVHQLIELEATSDEARFLATQLVRNRNKVAYQLRVALNACDEASRALRET
jgi:hypothetical protein